MGPVQLASQEKHMAFMHTYSVFLVRVESNVGPLSNLRIEVRAPDNEAAKRTAAAQFPGYRSTSASRVIGG
jgi:hypothetical protein